MSTDRFDLEAAIMDVWAIKDQVNKLQWRMYDCPELLSEDEEHNHIMGIEYAIELNCSKLMDTFCQVFELNEYATDEMKELRNRILTKLEEDADTEDFHTFPVPKKGKKK